MPALQEKPVKLTPGQRVPVLYRSFEIDQRKVNREERTVEICFATEVPAERYFGNEILLCGPENVRLKRLNNKGAFLFEHDTEKQIGAHVPGSVRMDPDKKGRAMVKFSRSMLGEEQWQDVQDGIRTLISVGYVVHKYEVDEENEVFTATDWEPLENSLVSIPVDTACGVGRSAGDEVSTKPELTHRAEQMSEKNENPQPTPPPNPPPPPQQTKFDRDLETKKLREKLVEDQNKIRELGKRFEMFGGEEKMEDAIRRGITPTQFQNELVESFDPEAIRPQPGDHQVDGRSRVTVEYEPPGVAFSSSPDYRRSVKFGTIRQPINVELPKANVRATITTTGLTSYSRPPGVIDLGTQRLTVRDLLAQGTTDASTVRYSREVAIPTFTGKLTTAEDTAKKETTWSLAEVDSPVRKIAVIGRVSEEAYSDQAFIRSYIDERLRYLVMSQEENQLLSGTGVSPDLQGILTVSGIQTLSGATGVTAENVLTAITNVRVNALFEPDGIVMHPTDYKKIRVAKDTNGQYFGGGYFYSPYAGAGMFQQNLDLWGLKTVVTTAMTAGTILVGAFKMGAQIFDREGLRVDTTETDGSDWSSNRIAVRVEERLALAIYRPNAFCTVTAIP